ncbi:hypothetical protein HQ571_02195 [Candidatus Kuenenbacteria bacterium]|nr:hypothetical protein [Candidatus Kuenenbacteria bacterium]
MTTIMFFWLCVVAVLLIVTGLMWPLPVEDPAGKHAKKEIKPHWLQQTAFCSGLVLAIILLLIKSFGG